MTLGGRGQHYQQSVDLSKQEKEPSRESVVKAPVPPPEDQSYYETATIQDDENGMTTEYS